MTNPFAGMTQSQKTINQGRLGNSPGILMNTIEERCPNNRIKYRVSLYLNAEFLTLAGFSKVHKNSNLYANIFLGENCIGLEFIDSTINQDTGGAWKLTTPSKTTAGRVTADCTEEISQEFFRSYKGRLNFNKLDKNHYLLKK